MEPLQEALEQLVCVVDPLGVFSHDPDHCCPRLRFIQRVQVLTQGGNHTLVPTHTHHIHGYGQYLYAMCERREHARVWRGRHLLVRVLAENVLDDHDGLLHHVVDLGLNEVQQGADAALGRLLKHTALTHQHRSTVWSELR